MPEVSLFLAITAEEESASAVFHALRQQNYKGSDALSHKRHVQKTALHPFLLAIGKLVSQFPQAQGASFVFDTDLSKDKEERLRLRIPAHTGTKKEVWAHPSPPLEFVLSVNGEPYDFRAELNQLASEKNAKNIGAHVKRLANRRNQALYAAATGIPHAQDVKPFLIYRKSVVFSHFMAYLMIEPYPVRQLFVRQASAAYLKMLEIMPSEI